jgi:hypothetical protein
MQFSSGAVRHNPAGTAILNVTYYILLLFVVESIYYTSTDPDYVQFVKYNLKCSPPCYCFRYILREERT